MTTAIADDDDECNARKHPDPVSDQIQAINQIADLKRTQEANEQALLRGAVAANLTLSQVQRLIASYQNLPAEITLNVSGIDSAAQTFTRVSLAAPSVATNPHLRATFGRTWTAGKRKPPTIEAEFEPGIWTDITADVQIFTDRSDRSA